MATVEIWHIPLATIETGREDSHTALTTLRRRTRGRTLSLSHTDGLALIAVADCAVGVDVEHVRAVPTGEELEDLALLTLSDAERSALAAAERGAAGVLWLQLWTRKEAVLKAAGGLLGDRAISAIDAFADGVHETHGRR
jgi:phosphopantetheinyl transferase